MKVGNKMEPLNFPFLQFRTNIKDTISDSTRCFKVPVLLNLNQKSTKLELIYGLTLTSSASENHWLDRIKIISFRDNYSVPRPALAIL